MPDRFMKLEHWFKPTDDMFEYHRLFTLDYDDAMKRRVFIDRGSDVLFIAHLDTVLPPKMVLDTARTVYATGLDDRLGCFTAYTLSKQLNCDLLLTDNEEKCQSTAKYHDCKQYNFIVEFDRAGDDVVTYDLDNDIFKNALSEFWRIGIGSFSDISELKTDCCCMNLGIGYQDPHGKNSYVKKNIYMQQIKLFRAFYAKYKGVNFGKHDEITWRYDRFDEFEMCDFCNENIGDSIHGCYICSDCFDTAFVWEGSHKG